MTSLRSVNVCFLKTSSPFNISTLGTMLPTQKPLGASMWQAGFQPRDSPCWDKVLLDIAENSPFGPPGRLWCTESDGRCEGGCLITPYVRAEV